MAQRYWRIAQALKEPNSFEHKFVVLVLNQPILCDTKLIKSLWHKASLRALVDGGSNRWLNFIQQKNGFDLPLPDFISGDFDSILPSTKSYFEDKNVTFISTPDQDHTDFTKALNCLKNWIDNQSLEIEYVFVICENSGRFDHLMGNVNTLHSCMDFLQGLFVAMISSQSVTWILPQGEHIIPVTPDFVEKHYCCGLIPFCGPTVITTKGLKWDLDKTVSKFGGLISCCNTYSSSEVYISCDQNLAWTSEYC